jgi:hypothetical protein
VLGYSLSAETLTMVGGMLFLACPQDFRRGQPFSPGTTGSGTTVFHGAGTLGAPGYGSGAAGGATGTTAGASGTATLFRGTPGGAAPAPASAPPTAGRPPLRLGDRRQVGRCPPAERTPPRSGRRPASICAAVVGLRWRCPATPHVAGWRPSVVVTLPKGCAFFVVRRCRFRCFPTPLVPT